MPRECCRKRLESAASCTSLGIKHLSALSVETTFVYLHANLELKERAMAKTSPSDIRPARYRPDDDLLAFLNGL